MRRLSGLLLRPAWFRYSHLFPVGHARAAGVGADMSSLSDREEVESVHVSVPSSRFDMFSDVALFFPSLLVWLVFGIQMNRPQPLGGGGGLRIDRRGVTGILTRRIRFLPGCFPPERINVLDIARRSVNTVNRDFPTYSNFANGD